MSFMIKLTPEEMDDVLDGRTKTSIARKVGVTRQTVLNVFNGKSRCSRDMAYCLTKALNSEAEIYDYFVRVKRNEKR